jgi:hypothetical protein
MSAIRSHLNRFGLAAVGGLGGYAIANDVGLLIGIAIGLLLPVGWLLISNRGEIGAEIRKARQAPNRQVGLGLPPSVLVLCGFFACGALLVGYAAVVASNMTTPLSSLG